MKRDHHYLVTWQIDIDAKSPRAAAKKALEIQRDQESTATVFDVYDSYGAGKTVRVDLSEED